MVPDQVNQERAEQGTGNAFVIQQQLHVEQIARMLPVERRDQLAGVDVFERQHLHRRKAELLAY